MLGAQSDSVSGNYLRTQLQALIGGKGNPKTNLDIVEAARNRSDANIKKLVTEYDQSIATAEPMVKYAVSLQGGDVDRGEDVFMNHGAAQCVRCHKVNDYGAEVGPDLTTIGLNHDREYLLQAIVDPGAVVAPGFGMMVLTRKNGEVASGLLMEDNEDGVSLKLPDGKIEKISHSEIASKQPPISGMPPMGLLLNHGEVRDLVAYLGSLNRAPKVDGDEHE
jgi:putative heme-binding domain-containing protein